MGRDEPGALRVGRARRDRRRADALLELRGGRDRGRRRPSSPAPPTRRLRAPGVAIADEVLPALVNALSRGRRRRSCSCSTTSTRSLGGDPRRAWTTCVERLPPGRARRARRPGRSRRCGSAGCARAASSTSCARRSCASPTRRPARCSTGSTRSRSRRSELAALQHRTEGWVAGLNLIALTLRDRPGRADVRGPDARRRPLPRRLPLGRGRGAAGAGAREFLMRTVDPRAAVGPALRRRRRSAPTARSVLGAARARQPLRRPAGPGAALVPLPPPLPRDAAAPARAARARRGRRPAPPRERLVRRAVATSTALIEHAIGAGDVHVAADTLHRTGSTSTAAARRRRARLDRPAAARDACRVPGARARPRRRGAGDGARRGGRAVVRARRAGGAARSTSEAARREHARRGRPATGR